MMSKTSKLWSAGRAAILGLATGVILVLGVGAASAQQVVVVGNQRIEAETIRSYLNLRAGPFDAARQNDAVQTMFATGLFSDVRISREGGRIVVRVTENPVVNRVTFEGNRRIDTATLRREAELAGRGVFTQARLQQDVQRIQDVYRRSGRFDVRIEPQVVQLPQNRVDVVFNIAEGERTQISRIAFTGNNAFGAQRLRDVITTKETNFLSWLSPRDIYDPDRLAVDQELLRRFYLRNGYADFRVVNADAQFDQARNGFTITIAVEEGEQYRFGTIEVESNVSAVDAATLRSFVRTAPGAIYNAELVDRTLEEMSTEIARRGYAFAQVRPRGERDASGRVVNIVYVVDEGPRLYVERINIRGNTRTMDRVIRREFDMAEGDALNRVQVERAERRLNQLNYFQTVRITREAGSSPDRVVLNVNVEERSTGEVSFGVGFASNEGFIADISISERNFLGRGQFVRAALGWGESRRTADFSFTEPYFLDRRLSAGFDLFYRRNLATRTQSFDQQIIGGGIRLGVAIDENLSAVFRHRIYEQRINVPAELWDCEPRKPGTAPFAPNVPAGINTCQDNGEASAAIKSSNGRALVSMSGVTFVYNRLDQPRNPRNGIYADLNLDLAGVGGDVRFIRATGEFRAYHNIVDDLVGMVRLQGGTMAGWGGQDVRVVDSFFRGADLVRGFASSGLGPRDISTLRADSLGGTSYLGVSAELQFPVPFVPDELGLRGALFADAGTLFTVGGLGSVLGPAYVRCSGRSGTTNISSVPGQACSYFDDSWSIRSSVGLSLLWQSPLGPLRFDFAYPLTKEFYDRTQFFRFSGGSSF